MIKAVLVDDEKMARDNLSLILQQYCAGDIIIAGQAANVTDAFRLIKEHQPGLVFLDIEMGSETGFDLVKKFSAPAFQVVFVTAFDQYAIRAIKICALDYLLKPLNITEVTETVQKAKMFIESGQKNNLNNFLNVLTRKGDSANLIAIPVTGGYRMIAAADITFLKAEKEYTYIYSLNGETFCSSVNLGYYEELLGDYPFYRIHHSYIINKAHLKEYTRGEGGEVVMSKGQFLPVSRRRKAGFLQWLMK